MYHYDIMYTASMVYIDFGKVTGSIKKSNIEKIWQFCETTNLTSYETFGLIYKQICHVKSLWKGFPHKYDLWWWWTLL